MLFDWGYVATKENALYLYVTDKTRDEIYVPGILSPVKEIALLGSDREVVSRRSGNALILEQREKEMMIPVYRITFREEPVFGKDISPCESVLSLGVLWGGKVHRDHTQATPTPLAYMKDTYMEGYGQQGLCLNKDVQTIFWTDEEEVLCWDANFEEAGEYEAVLIHDLSYSDPTGTIPSKGNFLLKVGEETNAVNMEEEKERFQISKTAQFNTRISRDCGVFTIKEPGKYRICLMHDGPGDNFLITHVNFRRK